MQPAIIAAMAAELQPFQQKLANPQNRVIGEFNFTTGIYADHLVVLAQSGIGKVNAAISTALLQQVFGCTAVINVGSACGLQADQVVGDLVIADQVCHHDVDVTAFGYNKGQVPELPACYSADATLLAHAGTIASFPGKVHQGLVVSGDTFLHYKDHFSELKIHFPEARAADMETSAIAQTCHQLQLPFIALRTLSDIAGCDNKTSFEAFLPQATICSEKWVGAMLKTLKEAR